MPVPIQWLRAARQNLDDEATYIAQDDAAAASRVVARVLEAVAQLAQQPGLADRVVYLAPANWSC